MIKPTYIAILLPVSFIIASFLVLHYYSHTTNTQGGKLNVVCTTSIITDAVITIGGDKVSVTTLMGPGVDPHIYRAREHDVHALANADVIFYNGLHLEGKMAELLHQLGAYTTSVAVADSIPQGELIHLPEYPDLYDPHVWFDVHLWRMVAAHIGTVLAEQDPAHADYYARRTQRYCTALDQLHAYAIHTCSTLPAERRILVTAHDAFSYFGKAYGFRVVGLQGISTESEASLHDIYTLTSFIIEHQIPAIFVESSIPHRTLGAVQHALQARNWSITIHPELYSDTLGTPGTPAGSYCGMIKHNVDAIVGGLMRQPTTI